jgi:hypothetical protein
MNDLCMADPPAACHCGRCVQRSRLTNREVADTLAETVRVDRKQTIDRILHLATVTPPGDESRTALTIEKVALILAFELGVQVDASGKP